MFDVECISGCFNDASVFPSQSVMIPIDFTPFQVAEPPDVVNGCSDFRHRPFVQLCNGWMEALMKRDVPISAIGLSHFWMLLNGFFLT